MNEQEKRGYLRRYGEAKKKGVPFAPDILFKDAVVSLAVLVTLVVLAYFLGAPLEDRANPADAAYTPRPEWYFIFAFQVLKYFPGDLEVVGIVVVPTLVLVALFAIPYLDRSARRHPLGRPVVVGATAIGVAGVVFLTMQGVREAPPPAEVTVGDPTALLYTRNCAPCHGLSIAVPAGKSLHEVIAQGNHEGMPAWSADLTSDEIDALAGFILSPGGSGLFSRNCGDCHKVSDLVAGDPLELKRALEEGKEYPPHVGKQVANWSQSLSAGETTDLLNFLVAPDGQRLFAINCEPCHGSAVSFSGSADELRATIAEGGLHLAMPSWREKLSDAELDLLAGYVTGPDTNPNGGDLFKTHCAECHGKRIPRAVNLTEARSAIAGGGAHKTMPVWGKVLTADQLDALTAYALQAASGAPRQAGQQRFAKYCSVCHGPFGEGGPNPTRPNDIILPISSAEYLETRDDYTLRSIIARGQPDSGMSPFGIAYGGLLEDEDIDTIVTYIRSWQANPPVQQPPEVAPQSVTLKGPEIYAGLCAQCHGARGEGGRGPAVRDPGFQENNSDQAIGDTIRVGHPSAGMIGWGQVLTEVQIRQLVDFIRELKVEDAPVSSGGPTFTADVAPIFKAQCASCHGAMGGWDGSNYDSAMSTGDHAPVVVPGDVEGSLLAVKILGTQQEGMLMPPAGKLPDGDIKVILDWIAGGARK